MINQWDGMWNLTYINDTFSITLKVTKLVEKYKGHAYSKMCAISTL